MHDQVMILTGTSFTEALHNAKEQTVTSAYKPSNMVIVCDTSSYHDDHLC